MIASRSWIAGLLLLSILKPVIGLSATVACGGVDDTVVIQAALNDVRANGGGLVTLPLGICPVRALNARDLVGVRIEGITATGTRLVPLESNGIVVDLTDAADVTLANFSIGNWNQGALVPRVGLLTAQSNASIPASNVVHLDRLSLVGTFAWAAWLNLGGASSTVMRSQFSNFSSGIGTVVFVAFNWMGLASPFGPLMAGQFPPTDWTFMGSEIHNFSSGVALWLGGADSLRFFGGNMSVNNGFPSFIVVNVAGSTPTGPNLVFDGTTFYTDDGSLPRCLIQSNQGPLPVDLRANYLILPAFC